MNDQKETPGFLTSLAEDARPGVSDSAALPSRLDRYAVAHKRALDMADFIASNVPGQDRILTDLRTCGSYLVFRDYFTVGMVRLAGACFCKNHLICPLCAIRRGAKLLKSYLGKLQVIQEENPGLRPYLVTLTVKNGPDLEERFQHLHNSVKRYHQARRSAIRAKGPMVESAKAAGAVWSYEFKRGRNSGGWHPHLHAVWLCSEVPDQDKLSKEWESVTGDSFIVDVRPITTEDDAVGGFLEVFKYAVKFSDLPFVDNWEGFQILKGRRMVASFGHFRGVQEPDDLSDDLLSDDLPFVEMLFRYRPGAGYSLERYDAA